MPRTLFVSVAFRLLLKLLSVLVALKKHCAECNMLRLEVACGISWLFAHWFDDVDAS